MKVERGFGYGAGVPIRFLLELGFGAQRGAILELRAGSFALEDVCGTVFGGRFWSSERGALRLEGACGTVFGGRFWSS